MDDDLFFVEVADDAYFHVVLGALEVEGEVDAGALDCYLLGGGEEVVDDDELEGEGEGADDGGEVRDEDLLVF